MTNNTSEDNASQRQHALEEVLSRTVIASLNSPQSQKAWRETYRQHLGQKQQPENITEEQIADHLTTLTELAVTKSIESLRQWMQTHNLRERFRIVDEQILAHFAQKATSEYDPTTSLTTPKSLFPQITKTHVRIAAKKTQLEKLNNQLTEKETLLEQRRSKIAAQLEEAQNLCDNISNIDIPSKHTQNGEENVVAETM